MARAMSMAVAFMLASAMVQANQCSSGGECPSDNKPKNVVSLLQTKLRMNVLEDGGASAVTWERERETMSDKALTLSQAEMGMSKARAIHNYQEAAQGQTNIRTVHVLSMGREASCFIDQLVGDSHANLFEPLGGMVEGNGILTVSKRLTDQRLRCLYDCSLCTDNLINSASQQKLQEYCQTSDRYQGNNYMVVKTTRIVDHLALVRAVPQDQLDQSRFIVLLRDPRSVWASTKPFGNWAISSITCICELLALQALSLPDLIAAVGKERVMVAVYEKWTMDTVGFGKSLSELLGEPTNKFAAKAKDGQRPVNELMPPPWASGLSPEEKQEVESDPNCAIYMSRLGYKSNSYDYSELKTSLQELAADLTPPEEAWLKRLRDEQQL